MLALFWQPQQKIRKVNDPAEASRVIWSLILPHFTAKGIEFEVPYREIEALGLAIAFFTDPSGVRIELTEGLDAF